MLLYEYLEKHLIDGKDFAKKIQVSYEHLRMIVIQKHFPSRKLAMRIEVATNKEVSKYEAIFPEDFERSP